MIDIKDVLHKHKLWLKGCVGGKKANLSGANLSGAKLSDADLMGADLIGTYLSGAYLSGAYLRNADLRNADLMGADLRNSDLSGAYLMGADLRNAYLMGADLRNSDLRNVYLKKAYLMGADLRNADLMGADLRDANLSGANLPYFQIPQEGGLVAWKAINRGVAQIFIPEGAKRTGCLISRKCRAEYVKTLEIYSREGVATCAKGLHRSKTSYTTGQLTYPDEYDDDIRLECTHGIHFFLTREEAKDWLEWVEYE